jgi:hypothetical protein
MTDPSDNIKQRVLNMAFWIKKPTEENVEAEVLEKKPAQDKSNSAKKEEQKTLPKRIDNLRIPERLRIHLRSFGTNSVYTFWTKDLSATGAFVLCLDFGSYPFQPASTIIEATVELKDPITLEVQNLDFMARVARVVEAHGAGAAQISGFGLRIIQMDFGERQVLETFIASHGKPDHQIGRAGGEGDETIHYEYDFEKGIAKGSKTGSFDSHLESDLSEKFNAKKLSDVS